MEHYIGIQVRFMFTHFHVIAFDFLRFSKVMISLLLFHQTVTKIIELHIDLFLTVAFTLNTCKPMYFPIILHLSSSKK